MKWEFHNTFIILDGKNNSPARTILGKRELLTVYISALLCEIKEKQTKKKGLCNKALWGKVNKLRKIIWIICLLCVCLGEWTVNYLKFLKWTYESLMGNPLWRHLKSWLYITASMGDWAVVICLFFWGFIFIFYAHPKCYETT